MRKGDDWRGELRINFPYSLNDIATQVTDFRLTDTGVFFIQPHGVGDGIVQYEGVYTGKSLEGQAQIIMKNGGVVAVGRWSLKHRK